MPGARDREESREVANVRVVKGYGEAVWFVGCGR